MKWKIFNTILSISLVWRHILTSSLFCSFCFDNTQLLAPIFWNSEKLYFSLPEGEVRFLKSACTNSHQPKKYFMSLFAMWDGKAWISHAQPMENPKKIQNHPLLVQRHSYGGPIFEKKILPERYRKMRWRPCFLLPVFFYFEGCRAKKEFSVFFAALP